MILLFKYKNNRVLKQLPSLKASALTTDRSAFAVCDRPQIYLDEPTLTPKVKAFSIFAR